jgi:hypothetical protein
MVGATLLLTGCAITAPAPSVEPDSLDDVTFLSQLADRPMVSVAEAYRAVLILADGQDDAQSFAERQDKLVARGIARAAWGLGPDQAIDKGAVAYMVMRTCQIHGGLNCRTFGSWGLGDRRYAFRELVYQRLLPDDAGSDYQVISGGEFVGLLHKADEHMQKAGVYEAAEAEMPTPTP